VGALKEGDKGNVLASWPMPEATGVEAIFHGDM